MWHKWAMQSKRDKKEPKKAAVETERVRINGMPASRLRALHNKTCVPMDRLAQMVFESSLRSVEIRFSK